MEDNNNINQNANPAADQGTGEKTFTQEDVNRIVSERLAKEKARNSGEPMSIKWTRKIRKNWIQLE